MKLNKHIEIVRASKGGHSAIGQKSCDTIRAVLEQHYERVGVTIVNEADDLEILAAKQPDLVFLGVRKVPSSLGGEPATTVWTGAYLEEKGLSYTGSPANALVLDISKPLAKEVVKAAGLSTADYFSVSPGQYKSMLALPLNFPLFVKPPDAGGSKGIGADSVVRDFADFEHKVQAIHEQFNTNALAETYLTGREFSVAVLADPYSDELTAMPIELVTGPNINGDRILGKDIKAADTERVIALQDPAIRQAVVTLALDVFQALGARDFGRIDIRLDEHGVPHFLEANLIPGLSAHDSTGGYFTRACRINEGMDYESMLLRIVELALARDPAGKRSLLEPAGEVMLPSFGAAFEPV